jgi:hypothetical protein
VTKKFSMTLDSTPVLIRLKRRVEQGDANAGILDASVGWSDEGSYVE